MAIQTKASPELLRLVIDQIRLNPGLYKQIYGQWEEFVPKHNEWPRAVLIVKEIKLPFKLK